MAGPSKAREARVSAASSEGPARFAGPSALAGSRAVMRVSVMQPPKCTHPLTETAARALVWATEHGASHFVLPGHWLASEGAIELSHCVA